MAALPDFKLLINGKMVPGASTFAVDNPSTGQVFAQCPDASKAQLDEAVDAGVAAFKKWSRTPIEERRDALKKVAELIGKKAQAIAKVLTLEQGKPVQEAMGELLGASAWCAITAGYDLPVKVISEDDKSRVEVRRKPLGLVGGICPWNFPIMLAFWKIAPALLSGNTIIVKPSPYTPLATCMMGEIFQEAVPPGVVQILAGGNDLGLWMTKHPGFAKISFTGSTATGKAIQEACADDLKRVTLELGGNDAAIVCKDVDPKTVAPQIFAGAFANSGQVCSAIKRVFVHEDQYDAFCDAMGEEAKAAKFGDGMDPNSKFGPINNKMQFDRVIELVEDAKKQGAEIVTGGAPMGKGYLYQPTVIKGVAEGVRIVDEEQFGPAIPILKYKTEEEAVYRANNCKYGLSGSVWSTDIDKAAKIANELDCGTSWVNQHLAIMPHLPFGGTKWSGIGRENGEWGFEAFTEPHVLNIVKKPAFSRL